ncbi:hypothetical protein PENTCL1PPCAC_29981, partial [Pristionchus entomophagus]
LDIGKPLTDDQVMPTPLLMVIGETMDDTKRRWLHKWIRAEMICHHILCTFSVLIGRNIPLLIMNLAMDLYNLR